jgi:hypothetical protein
MRAWMIVLLSTILGCSGSVGSDAESGDPLTRGGGGGGVGPVLPPATPELAWQFYGCLTNDQRFGLQAAMLDLAERGPFQGLGFLNPGTASVCGSDGDERGGVFRNISNVSGRIDRGVAAIAIRPGYKQFAFAAMPGLLATVATHLYANMPRRFDANGTLAANGRFEIVNPGLAWNTLPFQVTDLQTNITMSFTTDVPIVPQTVYCLPQFANGTTPQLDSDTVGPPSNFLSKDPLKQIVLSAVQKAIQNWGNYSMPFSIGAQCLTLDGLSLWAEPALAAWPGQFEDENWYVPASLPKIFYGPDLIQ